MRIVVADDHPISRSGIEFLLSGEVGMELVGSAEDGEQALALACALQPDVLILDLMLPKLSGLIVLDKLRHQQALPSVIAISGQASGLIFKQAQDAGAQGLISKEDDSTELLAALEAVGAGRSYRSRTVSRLMGALDGSEQSPALTPREKEVLACVAAGLSNEEIGSKLRISPKTVKKHRENIHSKLGISTAVQAAQAAARLGLAKLN